MIREVIVVEGKDDEAAVRKAVDAQIIITHGYGINDRIIKQIEQAYKRCGIIIFTDPDYAGENIRKKISSRFPDAKHAFISRQAGTKDDDIGVENASPENIRKALEKARAENVRMEPIFTVEDLWNLGLCAGEDAAEKRDRLGELLGIGYGNTKTFLRRLNNYGITMEEFKDAVKSLR